MSVYDTNFQKYGLSPSQLKIIELIEERAKHKPLTILELGCASGYMTKIIKKLGQVDVVDVDKKMLQKASHSSRKSYLGSLDDQKFLKTLTGKYDVIVAADVFEHLQNPEQCVQFLKSHLADDGHLIFSLPNIACWKIRKELFLNGFFEYQEIGILDKTHLKFFTYNSIQKWLKQQGYIINEIECFEIDYPLRDTLLHVPLGSWLVKFVDKKMIQNYPNLSAAHMVVKVSK